MPTDQTSPSAAPLADVQSSAVARPIAPTAAWHGAMLGGGAMLGSMIVLVTPQPDARAMLAGVLAALVGVAARLGLMSCLPIRDLRTLAASLLITSAAGMVATLAAYGALLFSGLDPLSLTVAMGAPALASLLADVRVASIAMRPTTTPSSPEVPAS